MTSCKDVLHLYLGCEVTYMDGETRYILNVERLYSILTTGDFLRWKPILRPLSDMTVEEGIEAENEWRKGHHFGTSIGQALNISSAIRVKWLLSKHFDLFGLIESGQAIDIKELTKPLRS